MTIENAEQDLGYAPMHVHVVSMPAAIPDRPKEVRTSHKTVILTAANPSQLVVGVDPARKEVHIEPLNNSVVMSSSTSQAGDPGNQVAFVNAITQPVPSQPAVPATGVAQQNVNAYPVQVVISPNGATISNVSVNGITVGTAAGTYTVPAFGAISIAYTVATPTWVWSNANANVAAVNAFPNGRILSSTVGEYIVPGGANEIWFTASVFPTLVGITVVREI